MDRRDPSRSATRLALTDGERALQIRVHQKLNVTLILDLMARAGETLEGRQCSSMPKEAWKPTFGLLIGKDEKRIVDPMRRPPAP